MSLDGHQTCPHCRALVQSTICSICGKTAFEEVAPPPAKPASKWTDAFENNELRKAGITLVVLALVAGAVALVLTRSSALPTANSLPPPASTTTTEPRVTSSEPPPSLLGGARPATGFVPGAPREVGEGLSPWETPPPIDFVTGLLLDESLDYSVDIARLGELLAVFPAALTLNELDPPELQTFDGSIDLELVETTQPFAARTLARADGVDVGQLWIVASGGSEPGDAYLAAARRRWSVEAATDQYSPEVGVRLWLLGADETTNLWAGDLDERSMVLVQAPTGVDPQILTDVLKAWRRLAG